MNNKIYTFPNSTSTITPLTEIAEQNLLHDLKNNILDKKLGKHFFKWDNHLSFENKIPYCQMEGNSYLTIKKNAIVKNCILLDSDITVGDEQTKTTISNVTFIDSKTNLEQFDHETISLTGTVNHTTFEHTGIGSHLNIKNSIIKNVNTIENVKINNSKIINADIIDKDFINKSISNGNDLMGSTLDNSIIISPNHSLITESTIIKSVIKDPTQQSYQTLISRSKLTNNKIYAKPNYPITIDSSNLTNVTALDGINSVDSQASAPEIILVSMSLDHNKIFLKQHNLKRDKLLEIGEVITDSNFSG